MGNTTPSSQTVSQIIHKHWQPITPNLWKNKATSEIIKEKQLNFPNQQQMNHAFSSLVKRMNNYHPNILKVFYLKKHIQKDSTCNCGDKHIIQVFVQNVEFTLQKYIKWLNKNQQQQINKKSLLKNNRKCLCMQIIKAAVYLKQRYGPFIVSKQNIWIQQSRVEHQNQDKQAFLSQSRQKSAKLSSVQQKSRQQLKAKLWISKQQENYSADQPCSEKQMCLSIVDLIRNVLVKNRLCDCHQNMEVLGKYSHLNSVNQLSDAIRNEHQFTQKVDTVENDNIVRVEQKVPFTRSIRSFSSQDSSSQPQPYFVHNLPLQPIRGFEYQQQQPERKYSSIQYVRKPVEKQNFNVGKRIQIPKNPFEILQDHLLIKNQNKSMNIQPSNNRNDLMLQQGLVPQIKLETVNVNVNERFKFNRTCIRPKQQHNTVNLQNFKAAQIISSRGHMKQTKNHSVISISNINYGNVIPRHENKSLVDGRLERESKNVLLLLAQDRMNLEMKKNSQFQGRNQIVAESHPQGVTLGNEIQERQLPNIDINDDKKIQYIEISQDKGTNPTDRTKFDLSIKQDERKQQQGVSTSRKNISIIPISLESTSGAGSILKPIVYSHDNLNKIQPLGGDFQQDIGEKNQQSIRESKEKKQSASSSKSEKNYATHQVTRQKKVTFQQTLPLMKKRMSESQQPLEKQIQPNIKNQQANKKDHVNFQNQQKQPNHMIMNKLQNLGLDSSDNQQVCRLRYTEYEITEQNSQLHSVNSINSKADERKQNRTGERKNELTSLALMQFKFNTNKSIQNHMVQQHFDHQHQGQKHSHLSGRNQVSIRQCPSAEFTEYRNEASHPNIYNQDHYVNKYFNEDKIKYEQSYHEMSSEQLQQMKETPNMSSKKSIVKNSSSDSQQSSSVKQSLRSIKFQTHSFSKNKNSYNLPSKQNNLQVSELIARQIERPSLPFNYNINNRPQNHHQQGYHININRRQTQPFQDSQQSLQRHKQMSHPLLTENSMEKKMSLKEEFNQLLNFGDENQHFQRSFKVKTQNDQKHIKLDQKGGKQTVSIYNQSDYNQSDNISKRNSHKDKDYSIKQAHPPKNKQSNHVREHKMKKPISKEELEKQLAKKRMDEIVQNFTDTIQPTPQQILRLTSSGHQDNSIKMKVISKKAEFAELKNQMNNLLL